jgi:hypothetical protein
MRTDAVPILAILVLILPDALLVGEMAEIARITIQATALGKEATPLAQTVRVSGTPNGGKIFPSRRIELDVSRRHVVIVLVFRLRLLQRAVSKTVRRFLVTGVLVLALLHARLQDQSPPVATLTHKTQGPGAAQQRIRNLRPTDIVTRHHEFRKDTVLCVRPLIPDAIGANLLPTQLALIHTPRWQDRLHLLPIAIIRNGTLNQFLILVLAPRCIWKAR